MESIKKQVQDNDIFNAKYQEFKENNQKKYLAYRQAVLNEMQATANDIVADKWRSIKEKQQLLIQKLNNLAKLYGYPARFNEHILKIDPNLSIPILQQLLRVNIN